ncbi:MAG: hypothetical protein FWH44_05955, partial [Methanomassiliicoccaceae archaeon]|nr:hypothetical protein [Methanomassiliicoccaceae archaeon]
MKKLGNVERKGVRNGGLKAAAAILLSVVMIAASVSLFSGSGNDGHEYDDRALGAAGDVQFKNMFGGQNSDSFSGSTATPDGGVVAVGYSFGSSFDGAGDWPDVAHATNAVIATIVKYDFMGNLEWNTSFPESAQSITTAQYRFTGVTAVTDGYVAVGNADTFISGDWDAGVTGKGSVDAIIVKFDLNGELQWAKNFGGNATDGFEGVTAMPDGGVIAVGFSGFASFNTGNWTGYYNYGTSNDDAIAVKFDAYGEVEWKDHFGGEGQDRFSDVVSIGNDFIVAGYSSVSSFGNNDWDSVTGRGGNDAIIVRYVYDSGTYDCETGWKVRFGGTGNDEFNALTVLSTGKIVAVGQSDNASFGTGDWTGVAAWTGASDATIAEFDADDGTPGWKDKFGGSAASNAYDYFNGVTAVYDGGFVAVGLSGAGSFPTGDWAGIGGKGNEDAIAVKYTAAGTVEWKKNFGGCESERF